MSSRSLAAALGYLNWKYFGMMIAVSVLVWRRGHASGRPAERRHVATVHARARPGAPGGRRHPRKLRLSPAEFAVGMRRDRPGDDRQGRMGLDETQGVPNLIRSHLMRKAINSAIRRDERERWRSRKGYVRSVLRETCSRNNIGCWPQPRGRAVPITAAPDGVESFQKPRLVRDWANRLLANDPKVRATAEAALVQGATRSLPLLRRFLDPGHEDLHVVTFEIIQRIGPPAIPLLVDLLRHEWDSVRRNAADDLIDLAPHTERIQPALRRALRDEDSMVAGDAARALGALGKRASPSVGALVDTLSHEDPYVRIYAAEALASIGPNAAKATNALAEALGDPIPGVRWAACEALASIGPAAQSAVPQLIEALEDEFLYVRIFAAGALEASGRRHSRPERR